MSLPYKQHPLYLEELDGILSVRGMNRLVGKTVLITGATGLIGTQMTDALMRGNRLGAETHVIAAARNGDKARERLGEHFGSPFFRFMRHDAAEPFPDTISPDYIIPLASFTHPAAYSRFPVETMIINLKGAEHALDLAARCGAEVLYPGTVEIYGNARDGEDFKEDSTGRLDLSTSRACYTESKRAAEAMCQSFRAEKGVRVVIGRLCRVFGPTILSDDSKASSQFLMKALRKEDIVLKSDGRQLFSYIYAADAVGALLHIMLNGEDGKAYNISDGKCGVRLKDFALTCAAAAGTRVVYDTPSDEERKGYSVAARAVLDSSRLLATGWRPAYDFQQAVRRTLEIMKANL